MAVEEGRQEDAPLHAVAAEFETGDALLEGVRGLRAQGLGRIDAHSPIPVPGMSQALGLDASSLSWVALAGTAGGFVACMALCLYASGYDYVFDIGGRPRLSWPAFVVPSFSFAMMAGAIAVYLVMLFLNRLPRLNHPAFNIAAFTRVTQDRYFLIVEEEDRPLDPEAIEAAFAALAARPVAVMRVPR